MAFIKHLKHRLYLFFTLPHSAAPLGIFRILIALFVLLQAALWYRDWLAFFGSDSWMQWEISRALVINWSIHISQVAKFFSFFGLNEDEAVWLFFWIYVSHALGLLVGWFTRYFAIITWFCHYIIIASIDAFFYGVDIFLHISLFYIMIMPVSKAFSFDARYRKINTKPSWGITLSLRVLQIHICLAYLSAGYEKMLSVDWWMGNVLWRSLVQPDFRQFDLTWLAEYPWIPMLLSWFTMIVETGYCIAMWIPRVRIFWIVAIIFLHIGIAVFLGLWLFALIMILLSISAFGYDVYSDIRKWRQQISGENQKPLSVMEEK
jgi:Vitamin K-dependent gamma-carboxylase